MSTPRKIFQTPAPTILAEKRKTYLDKILLVNRSTEAEIKKLREKRTRTVAKLRDKARKATTLLSASVKERMDCAGVTLAHVALKARVPMTKMVAMLYNDALAPSEVATAVADAAVNLSRHRGLRPRKPKRAP